MKNAVLIVVLSIILLSIFIQLNRYQPDQISSETTRTPTPPMQLSEDDVWGTVQKWRVETNRNQYKIDERLCEYARKRSIEVMSNFEHTGFNQTSRELLANTGYSKVAENLSSLSANPDEIIQAWLDSPEHRKTLEDNYTHSCLKCAGQYCVQIFGTY